MSEPATLSSVEVRSIELNRGIVFLNLVPSGDSEIAAAFADKGRNVGSGEENQSNWEVLHKSDIKAVFAAELDVGTLEEVKCGSIESTLCKDISMVGTFTCGRIDLLLGTANRRRPSRLEGI
jgi:hypothetical protein